MSLDLGALSLRMLESILTEKLDENLIQVISTIPEGKIGKHEALQLHCDLVLLYVHGSKFREATYHENDLSNPDLGPSGSLTSKQMALLLQYLRLLVPFGVLNARGTMMGRIPSLMLHTDPEIDVFVGPLARTLATESVSFCVGLIVLVTANPQLLCDEIGDMLVRASKASSPFLCDALEEAVAIGGVTVGDIFPILQYLITKKANLTNLPAHKFFGRLRHHLRTVAPLHHLLSAVFTMCMMLPHFLTCKQFHVDPSVQVFLRLIKWPRGDNGKPKLDASSPQGMQTEGWSELLEECSWMLLQCLYLSFPNQTLESVRNLEDINDKKTFLTLFDRLPLHPHLVVDSDIGDSDSGGGQALAAHVSGVLSDVRPLEASVISSTSLSSVNNNVIGTVSELLILQDCRVLEESVGNVLSQLKNNLIQSRPQSQPRSSSFDTMGVSAPANDDIREDDARKDDTTKDDAREDDTKEDDDRQDDVADDDIRQDDTRQDDIREDDATKDDATNDDATKDNSSEDDSRENDIREDDARQDDTRQDDTSEDATTEDATREGDAREDATREDDAREDDTREDRCKHHLKEMGQQVEALRSQVKFVEYLRSMQMQKTKQLSRELRSITYFDNSRAIDGVGGVAKPLLSPTSSTTGTPRSGSPRSHSPHGSPLTSPRRSSYANMKSPLGEHGIPQQQQTQQQTKQTQQQQTQTQTQQQQQQIQQQQTQTQQSATEHEEKKEEEPEEGVIRQQQTTQDERELQPETQQILDRKAMLAKIDEISQDNTALQEENKLLVQQIEPNRKRMHELVDQLDNAKSELILLRAKEQISRQGDDGRVALDAKVELLTSQLIEWEVQLPLHSEVVDRLKGATVESQTVQYRIEALEKETAQSRKVQTRKEMQLDAEIAENQRLRLQCDELSSALNQQTEVLEHAQMVSAAQLRALQHKYATAKQINIGLEERIVKLQCEIEQS